jgi:hypothetical protein
MSSFRPDHAAYKATDDPLYPQELVPLGAVKPIVRGPDTANFVEGRARSILQAIHQNEALPPVRVQIATVASEPYKFKLHDGFHRFHLSMALGFTHISVAVMSELDTDAL